ncbi:hypothetical protein [Tenacibaculum finnmarkense]|uniref:hypothetical protein n=1 Tax=Tenacibaculum finnmarkense TaxID=2781243 RepID=UPI00187BA78A|nr:hypothetical protein [Tenacibaculum finnmarkense]MBE7649192.1 hypothetical protein [Tenacibaculum finnmarkense genomovar ulcerans]MBE7693651.1 hypothetical protein [Tenacibaculum finnmarkense genomovar finnmarkense]MCD8411014.1 hypothetical protein [Tenacibaculum finnmarkense genomovar ulcerans]MCD8423557.1 hypothetical protein [Tenacibaculum finnmarkense genomovar ulcerans]MCG8237330.1 hypothetical protein [Tenacibaculum finnmarkense genomovar ulcerans]
MNEDMLLISKTLLIGFIVFGFVFRSLLKLKMNMNVYLLLLAYFISPVSIIVTIIIITYTIYKTYTVKTKLNKIIFFVILFNGLLTVLNYTVFSSSRNFSSSSSSSSDAAGNAMRLEYALIGQIVFQLVILVITIIILFVHKYCIKTRTINNL